MIREYTFHPNETIRFEDSNSVKELVQTSFDKFGYYEPYGIDIVTIFQSCHSKTSTGWFTLDRNRRCLDEIEDNSGLCFAYYKPGVFYYAEGGWGHHMTELGNHPEIPSSVAMKLQFDDFNNTVVINGKYSLKDIVESLKSVGYISNETHHIRIKAVYGDLQQRNSSSYTVPYQDGIMEIPLSEHDNELRERLSLYIDDIGKAYYNIFEIL